MTPMDLGQTFADAVRGSMFLALPVAFLAGLVSFLSPCILPLLPGYLSYASGLSATEITRGQGKSRRLLVGVLLFVLGFAAVFVVTGAIFGGLGQFFLQHQRLLQIVGGCVAIVLGLIFADLIPLGQRTVRPARATKVGIAAAPVLGIVFGLGWTPCIGPTLGTVLTLAMNESSALRGAILAFVYALGLGLPFVLAALAYHKVAARLTWVKRHQCGIQIAGGIIMIVVGVLLITGLWDWLMKNLTGLLAAIGAPL